MDKVDIEYEEWSDKVINDIRKYMPELSVNIRTRNKMSVDRRNGSGLGKLCINRHEYENTGLSLRRDNGLGRCYECKRIANRKYVEAKLY